MGEAGGGNILPSYMFFFSGDNILICSYLPLGLGRHLHNNTSLLSTSLDTTNIMTSCQNKKRIKETRNMK